MSTRDVARFIEGMFGLSSTVGNITGTVLEDIEQ